MVDGNEAGVVEEGDGAHDELAVHAVRHATVTGNAVTKVLDLESALETGCEEATERCDPGSKGSQDEGVEVERLERVRVADRETWRDEGNDVCSRSENWVGCAFQAGPDVCAEILRVVSSAIQDVM